MNPPPGATTEQTLYTRRQRTMYMWLGAWVLMLAAIVAYVQFDDPTSGHAGHVVFPDEYSLESRAAGRSFHLAKQDRIEKMKTIPLHAPANAWIRITSGPHAGRTGIIVW